MTLKNRQDFVHLHNHLEGSYSDSILRVTRALDRVKELGMSAFAVTDHGDLSIIPKFVREALQRGIKPILGMEAYFVEDAEENIRRRINNRNHLTLIAQNNEGWKNLVTIASLSWKDNCLMHKLGLVDWKLLEKYNGGLLCLSGCLAGPLGWSIKENKLEEADRFYGLFSDLFGDRFFIEVYNHGMEEEKKAAAGLCEIAGRYGRKAVLANDCHYQFKDEWLMHDTVIKTRFGKATEFELKQHEYYVKSAEEMRSLGFPSEYCDATIEIADIIELNPEKIFDTSSNGKLEYVFLGKTKPLSLKKAFEKAASALRLSSSEQHRISSLPEKEIEEKYPEVASIAKGIFGLPQKPEPDLAIAVRAPGLFSKIPVRRAENAVFTMWSEEECRACGAEILPIEKVPELIHVSKSLNAFIRGLEAQRKRKFDLAKKSFKESIELDPDFMNARYNLALCNFYSGNYENAISLLEGIIEREPYFERMPHLYSYLGWCNFHLGKYEESISLFQRSLDEKEISGSLLGKGLCLEQLGRIEEARTVLLRMVEIAPDDSKIEEAHNALERIAKL